MKLNTEPNEVLDLSETPGPVVEMPVPPPTLSSALRVEIAAGSHTGSDEAHNEDHYLVLRAQRSLEPLLTNLTETTLPPMFSETAYGMVVADGLSGLPFG